MSSFIIPDRIFDGVERYGCGRCQEDFDVYTIKVDSETIFEPEKTKVPSDEEYRKKAVDFAETLPAFNKSTCVKTLDGVPIIYFVKRGMVFPWGQLASMMISWSIAAIMALLAVYAPPNKAAIPPLASQTRELRRNRRHSSNLKTELEKSKDLGRPYGVFNWGYWIPTGSKGRTPGLSSATTPRDPLQLDALKTFFTTTKFEHWLISKWMKALEPESWQRYNRHYQEVRANGKLGILDVGDFGIESCRAFLVNAIANPHKDKGDVLRGWTISYPWGNFTGGDLVFLDLGIRLEQRAGDMLMAPASVLTHFVLPHSDGDRFSHVWFTKANIFDPPVPKFFCNIGRCTSDYKTMDGLYAHWKQKDDPYHEAARQRKKAGRAVQSDTATTQRSQANDAEGSNTGETEASDRPAKRQKVTDDPLALPEGAPTDTRRRFFCKVVGCNKSKASGFKGYTRSGTARDHTKRCHKT